MFDSISGYLLSAPSSSVIHRRARSPCAITAGGKFQMNAGPALTVSKHISVCLVRGLHGRQVWKQVLSTNYMHNLCFTSLHGEATTIHGATSGHYRAREFVVYLFLRVLNFPCLLPSPLAFLPSLNGPILNTEFRLFFVSVIWCLHIIPFLSF